MKKALLAAALAAFGLSACSSLNDKTPQEMMQISMARSLKQDSSCNFSGEARVYLSKQQEGVAPETAATADTRGNRASAANAATDRADTDNEKAVNSSLESEIDAFAQDVMMQQTYPGQNGKNIGSMMADALQEYPGLAHYLDNGRLKISGAVDMREQRIELVPELRMNGRNEQIAMQIPMLFDGKSMSLTAELPDSIPMILNFWVDKPIRNRLLNEPFSMTLSDEDKRGMPVRNALKAAVSAAYKAYGELPPDTFKLKDIDGFGRQIGSRYRLEMVLDDRTSRAYYEAALREFSARLDELKETSPEAGTTEAGYNKMQEAARRFVRINTMLNMDKLYGSPLFASFYLDRKGRLLGVRQYAQFNGSHGQAVSIDSNVKLYNFGKPVFSFQPKNAKTISITELRDAIRARAKNKKSSTLRSE